MPPWQKISVLEESGTNVGGCVMSPVVVAVQLWGAVTVEEWVPAGRRNVRVPLYGGEPPVALTVTVDMPPWQKISVLEESGTNVGGCVMSPVVVAVQLLESVTV